MAVSSTKPVVLVIPPVGDSTMPLLGPHALTGYLKSRGVPCKVCDASIETLRLAASPDVLRQNYRSEGACTDEAISTLLEEGIEAILQCEDKLQTLIAGLKLFSLRHRSFKLSPDDLTLPFEISTTSDLSLALKTVEPITNLFKETDAFASATADRNAIIGVSISFPSQLVMALAIGEVIKSRQPNCTLVFGGSYFSSMGFQAEELLESFDFIDAIIRGAGEIALESFSRGVAPYSMAGAVKFADERFIIEGEKCRPVRPDFSTSPWDLYASDLKAIPFSFYTVCHFGRCRFCNGDHGSAIDSIMKQTVSIDVEDLLLTVKESAADCVYVVDAAVPPDRLRVIAKSFDGQIRWAANTRPDSELSDAELLMSLRHSGCWMLRLGFESGSQKVLDAMGKGTCVQTLSRILKATSSAGIKNHLYIMLGYPGENESDREETTVFLREHKDWIHSFSISVFQANPGTEIYRDLCNELGVEAEEYNQATADINRFLFPNEESYRLLMRHIDNITLILKASSKTNREYYSGRVFNDVNTLGTTSRNLALVGPIETNSDNEFWMIHFNSVLKISPYNRNDRSKRYRVALIDLINDEVIIIESFGEPVENWILDGIKGYSTHSDMETLKRIVSPIYYVSKLGWGGGRDNAIQHTEALEKKADGYSH